MPNDSPAKTTISRVDLTVSDLAKSLDFYTSALGFRILKQADSQALLGAGTTNALLALHDDPQAKPAPGSTGLYHFAVRLPTRQALAQLVYHLALKEVPIQGFGDHGASESVYLVDPQGNGIEMYRDRPENQWQRDDKGQLQMGTDEVDLDDLLKLVRPEKAWSGLPEGSSIGHVHLHVADLEQSIAFYRDILGMHLTQRYGSSAAFLAFGGYHHHIGINTWAGKDAPPPPAGSAGLRSIDLLVTADGVEAVKERLAGAGWSFQTEAGGLIIEDPSQNTLRVMPA
ncbi:MAG: VOC family protein [Anaerolineae bacterium]|nr:VOC family protein [Anaerolineae bacterium]